MIYLLIPEPLADGRESLALLPITRCLNFLGGLGDQQCQAEVAEGGCDKAWLMSAATHTQF